MTIYTMTTDLEKKKEITINEAITLTGFGKFNLFVLFVTGGCLMCVTIESMESMFIIPAAECDLELGVSMKGCISGASFLGMALAAHLWGFLADSYGRRIVILTSMFSTFAVGIVSSLALNSYVLLFLRFLSGGLLSGTSSVVSTYIGEIHNDHHRPTMMTWAVMFIAIGNMVMSGLAWLILPIQLNFALPFLNIIFKSWRLLQIVYTLPTLFFAICMVLLPESPKFLLSQNRHDDACLIFKKMYASNRGNTNIEFSNKQIVLDEEFEQTKSEGVFTFMWTQTLKLYQKPYLLKTFLLSALQFGVFMTSTGIYMWYPEILNKISIFEADNSNEKLTICTGIEHQSITGSLSRNETSINCNNVINPTVFTINLTLGTFLVLLYFTTGCIVGYLGKYKTLSFLFCISTLASIAAQYSSGSLTIKISMALALASYTSTGLIIATAVDVYPTQMRGIGVAMSLMFGRSGAVVGSHLSGKLFYKMCNFSYLLYAAFHIVFLTIVYMLNSTTKKSKPKNAV